MDLSSLHKNASRKEKRGRRRPGNPITVPTHNDDDDYSTAGHFSGEEGEYRKNRRRQDDAKTMRKRAAVKEELRKTQQEKQVINLEEEESICEGTPPNNKSRGRRHQANSLGNSRTFAETTGDPLEVAFGQMQANGAGVARNRNKYSKDMGRNMETLIHMGGRPKGSTRSKRDERHAKAAESRSRTAESRQKHPYSTSPALSSRKPPANEEEEDDDLDFTAALASSSQRYTGGVDDSATTRRYSSDDLHDREVKRNDSSRRHSEFNNEELAIFMFCPPKA